MHGRLDLDRARREAKALLAAARAGDPAARERLGDAPQLSDAQLAVARELGERSWPALVRRAEAEALTRAERARRLVEWATTGRRDRAEALLAADAQRPADRAADEAGEPVRRAAAATDGAAGGPEPGEAREPVRRAAAAELAGAGLDAALVLGDAARVRRALARDPGVVTRPTGARGWTPLLYVTWSALRRPGRLDCARALLDHGADPNAHWEHPERGQRSALLGAAGDAPVAALLLAAGADVRDEEAVRTAAAAEDPATLRLLLEAGADPRRTFALATALEREAPDTVALLLDHLPADSGERSWALLWAIQHGRSEDMIRLLVAQGADLEAHDEANDRTPYGLAIRTGRADLAELLASLGAQRKAGPVDELLGACFRGDAEQAQRLAAERPEALALVRGAYAGALAEAAGEGRAGTVEILLALGVRGDSSPPAGTDDVPDIPRPHDPAEPDYAELLWAAEVEYLRILAGSPLVESRGCGDGFAVRSRIASNTENAVVCDHADDATIAELLAWLDVPAQWFVKDPTDLRERLVAAGATPERTGVVMGMRLDRPLPPPPPSAVEIAPVRDSDTLAAALAIIDDDARWIEVLASLDLHGPLEHRVALQNQQPVGAATFLNHDDTLYGLHLAVIPHARRSGIGSALMHHVLHHTSARAAVLAPTPETVPFYRRFGFELRPYLHERAFYLP